MKTQMPLRSTPYIALSPAAVPLAECVDSRLFNLGLIPGTPSLAQAGLELAADPGICLRFPMELKALDADAIIDTPPASQSS